MNINCGEIIIKRFQMEDFVETLLENGYKVVIENSTPEKDCDDCSEKTISIKIYK